MGARIVLHVTQLVRPCLHRRKGQDTPTFMKKLSCTLFLASLLNSSYGSANTEPGLDQYLAAIKVGEKVVMALEQLEETGKSEQNRGATRSSLNKYAPTYIEQLKASSDLGFPPGQFLYAHALIQQAAQSSDKQNGIKLEACRLLAQAAKQSLQAAALAQASYCSTLNKEKGFSAMLKAVEQAHAQLAVTVEMTDRYASFYPLVGFVLPSCPVRDIDSLFNGLEQLTPLQRMQALSPPLMTLEETRAEAFFMLAIYMRGSDPVKAADYLARAEQHGCRNAANSRLNTQRATAASISGG